MQVTLVQCHELCQQLCRGEEQTDYQHSTSAILGLTGLLRIGTTTTRTSFQEVTLFFNGWPDVSGEFSAEISEVGERYYSATLRQLTIQANSFLGNYNFMYVCMPVEAPEGRMSHNNVWNEVL